MVKCFIPKNQDVGSFVLRFSLGLIFLYAGFGKVFMGGASGLSNLLWGQLWLAYLVGVVELLGGLFLIIGFISRQASLSLIIIMIFAILLAHNPITMDNQMMNALIRFGLIGGLVQILLSGSGKIAIKKD
jgi:putative oxidoreductase